MILLSSSYVHAFQSAPEETIPLADALKKIEKIYQVRFVYENRLVNSIRVPFNEQALKSKKLEDVLRLLLAPQDLSFANVSVSYITIISNRNESNEEQQSSSQPPAVSIDSITSSKTTFLQEKRNARLATIKGKVVNRVTKQPVEFATVFIPELSLVTISDLKGDYELIHVPQGKWHIQARSVNMITNGIEVDVQNDLINEANIGLDENVLQLEKVEVIARETRSGASTASSISRTAIEHLQATSLTDVLQLLPGGLAVNPDFSKVNKASIRQVAADDAGSLGTAVIVNGIPISNNANLQVTNTASSGANASFTTSTGSGVDLRQISADNIESVEVIRGIPSVEHGDLNSGAILVKTKAGKYPFNIKSRINPKLTQLWAGKGFGLGPKGESLNVDVDYTRTFNDQRYPSAGYHRVTTNVMYSKEFFSSKPLFTTTGFTYAMNLDERKRDPDDVNGIQKYIINRAQDYAFRFNTSGRWSLQQRFTRTINYSAAINYSIQKGFQQSWVSGAIFPIVNALKDTTVVSQYSPNEYLGQLWIEGKPLNVFTKITNSFYGKTGNINHRVLMGAEWKMDANYGAGKTYDLSLPPQPAQSGIASRPRAYTDLPAMHQLSAYVEDNIYAKLAGKNLYVQAGLRADKMSVVGTALSPRVNASYGITEKLILRSGWGITTKAPTLLYLYPQEAYFDMVNLNWFAQNPNERLLIATTKIFNTQNPDLKIARSKKVEAGFEWHFADDRQLSMMAFREEHTNGYSFNTTLNSVKSIPFQYYTGTANPGTTPIVTEGDRVQRSLDYMMPANDRLNINKGIEMDLNLGRMDAIRTSFVLNGAWINSQSTSTAYYILKLNASASPSTGPDKAAVFAPGRGTENERWSTSLRVIHNIPETRFIITLLVQTIWIDKNKYLGYEKIPVGYIDRITGAFVKLTEEQRSQISSADRELYLNISDDYFITESWKPSWLFNLRLTKEIGKKVGFSFYTNNVFMNRPLVESNRWKGSFSYLNPSIFFGMEVNVKL